MIRPMRLAIPLVPLATAVVLVAQVSIVAALPPGPAAAPIGSPTERAAAHAEEGTAAYVAGNYDAAATAFDAAYQLDPLPTYLFNRAQSERLGTRCAAALASYRLYLARVPEAENRAEIEAWIAEQQKCVDDAQVEIAPPPVKEIPPPPPPPPPHRGQRIAGIGLMAGGAIGIGVGVFGLVRMGSASDDISALYAADAVWTADDASAYDAAVARGNTGERLTWLGFGLGAAAGITGAIVYLLAPTTSASPIEVAPHGDGAVVSMRGAF